jgi:predicted ATPase/DNA-binding CsgD family transcriptional regulator
VGSALSGDAGTVSRREAEVLQALTEHLTNADIAARLFISVRTVESHVSSLLRKFQVSDRRGLALLGASAAPVTRAAERSTMPSPLTSFVGRRHERAALAEALLAHRLVTALGPGGVGKTRLALSVANDVRERYADDVWFIDLVPVGDAALIASTIGVALGLGQHQERSDEDAILNWLAERDTLLVMDNCEHVIDGVAVTIERLLASCPRLRVLATSRTRLVLPFEWVYRVPGLSSESGSEAAPGAPGDAVDLFLQRAAASGGAPPPEQPDERAQYEQRIARLCDRLDGGALAIELAAARLPALGLDGLETGLSDRLELLTGGSRVNDRHRSLRAALDWSHSLLTPDEQAVLRRVSVFAAPFIASAAADIATGWAPVIDAPAAGVLAALADQSLLIPVADATGTQYRALETIRQYGRARLEEFGEVEQVRRRHLTWCRAAARALATSADVRGHVWAATFDRHADDFRGALAAVAAAGPRAEAAQFALELAELTFTRGRPTESQRLYERAATLTDDDATAARLLQSAAGAAAARHVGLDALRLRRAAADAYLRVEQRAAAAANLAQAAELISRGPGLLASAPEPGKLDELLAETWTLAGDDPPAIARALVAQAFSLDEWEPAATTLVERALVVARDIAAPLTESAALDRLTSIQLAKGDTWAAAASALRRTELLAPLPVTADSALEFFDAYIMGADTSIAIGDLSTAQRLAEGLRDLPFYREEAHLATPRLMIVATLVGDVDESAALSARFLDAWHRAGRPRAGNLSRGVYAAATAHGLRGDDEAREQWLGVVAALATPGRTLADQHFDEFFDALLLLHRGQVGEAMLRLAPAPETFQAHYNVLWRAWYAALWAEAAVLAGHESAPERIERAGRLTGDNPIAAAIVARAAALCGNRAGLADAATAFESTGCRYQWARTQILIGGEQARAGRQVMGELGLMPMIKPDRPVA